MARKALRGWPLTSRTFVSCRECAIGASTTGTTPQRSPVAGDQARCRIRAALNVANPHCVGGYVLRNP